MKKFLILISTIIIGTNLAIADNNIDYEGPYFGLDYSYSIDGTQKSEERINRTTTTAYFNETDVGGAGSIGLSAGYNWALKNDIITGLEINHQTFLNNEFNSIWKVGGSVDNNYPAEVKMKHRTDYKVKYGFISSANNSLLYVTTGISNLKYNYHNTSDNLSTRYKKPVKLDGYLLGVGGEYPYKNNISIKGEFLKAKYDPSFISSSPPNNAGTGFSNYGEDSTLKLGFVYHY